MDDSLQTGLIQRADDLARLAACLGTQRVVGVDTESNSLHAYREQVCLLQFSDAQADYLVDPLILLDLAALAPIFAAPEVVKVFHAAEYDVLCLKRDFDFKFENLFDTMVAARILGRKAVGLGSLVEAEFGIHLDKRAQRANWGRRPLPQDMLDYARQDTHYLLQLREILKAELEQKGLLPLAEEDFRLLCQLDAPLPQGERDIWHINGVHELNPAQAAVLQELSTYRARTAHAMDRPLFKVIGDKTLVAIAAAAPASTRELTVIPGMTRHQVQRHGRAILKAVQRGLKSEPMQMPHPPRPDERYMARMDALRKWRKAAADEMGVESDVVLPRNIMQRLAQEAPHSPAALKKAMADVPWRVERFGGQILKVLQKHSKK